MRRHLFYILVVALFLLLACRGNKTDKPVEVPDTVKEEVPVDTVQDTVATVDEPAPPAAADGVFGDFMFNFMRNRRFQRERVRFPLNITSGGTTRTVQSSAEWKHDRIFAHDEVYALAFNDAKSMRKSVMAKQDSVVISLLNFQDASVRNYSFHKERGAWMLINIETHGLREEAGSDFLDFISQFSRSAEYRISHVAPSFDLVVLDPDTYEQVKGNADASQWDDYAPELPTDKLALINCGGLSSTNSERIVQLTSMEEGMSSLITFRKQGGKWKAVKLEND